MAFISLALTAEPTWDWAQGYGSTALDLATGVVPDSDGNLHVCGNYRQNINFGIYLLEGNTRTSTFVVRLDPAGTVLSAVRAYSTGVVSVADICADSQDYLYITGYFTGTATFGKYSLTTTSSSQDIFVAKLDCDGVFQWARKAGGGGIDNGLSIACSANDDIFLCGRIGIAAVFGTIGLSGGDEVDIFVAQIDANGTWQAAKRYGAANDDQANGICADASGNIYLCGSFNGSFSLDGHPLSSANTDLFIARLNGSLETQWARQAGGNAGDSGNSVVCDALGNVYLAGKCTASSVFGSLSLNPATSAAFAAKLSSGGDWLWVADLGSNSYANNEAFDLCHYMGFLYAAGRFYGQVTVAGNSYTSAGEADAFISELDPDGTIRWWLQGGGSSNDYATAAHASSGKLYAVGSYFAAAALGPFILPVFGNSDAFVLKLGSLSSAGQPLPPQNVLLQHVSGNWTLSWDAVQYSIEGDPITVDGYRVFCAVLPQGEFILLGETTAVSLPLPPALFTGDRRFFQVRAVRADSP